MNQDSGVKEAVASDGIVGAHSGNRLAKDRFILQQLVSKDFKLKYRRSFLGVLWSVLNPLLMEALQEGILDGSVDCIVTDHAPHAPHEKDCEWEVAFFGTVGLETSLPLMMT